jgi:hypothetical protein
MGFRFRERLRITPGLWINLSKKGVRYRPTDIGRQAMHRRATGTRDRFCPRHRGFVPNPHLSPKTVSEGLRQARTAAYLMRRLKNTSRQIAFLERAFAGSPNSLFKRPIWDLLCETKSTRARTRKSASARNRFISPSRGIRWSPRTSRTIRISWRTCHASRRHCSLCRRRSYRSMICSMEHA